MSRSSQYLGVVVALGVGLVAIVSNGIGIFHDDIPTASQAIAVPPFVTANRNSTSTVAVRVASSSRLLPSSAASTTTHQAVVRSTTTVATDNPPPAENPPASGTIALSMAATALRAALVNILCYAPAGSGLHSISGSGIFIDPKGIILTNAHVAQYFLLRDRGVFCRIRSGSPATDAYRATLIYLSPTWIHANAKVLTETLPSGTGENDFALLAVTDTLTANAMPDSFPFIPLAYREPTSHTPVVIASFGAQFLQTSQIQTSLYPTIVFGSIKEVFTFATTTADVLDLGGSAAAQEGSSGGGVADMSGKLIGTITTSTVEGPTATRSVSAITAAYIRSAYAREMGGGSLDTLLEEPVVSSVSEFAPKMPVLESILTANLPS